MSALNKWISWCPTWNFQHLGEVPFPGHCDQAVAPAAVRRPLRDGHSLSCTLHWGNSPREGEGHVTLGPVAPVVYHSLDQTLCPLFFSLLPLSFHPEKLVQEVGSAD